MVARRRDRRLVKADERNPLRRGQRLASAGLGRTAARGAPRLPATQSEPDMPTRRSFRPTLLAAASLALCLSSAQALVLVNGNFSLNPNPGQPFGPGDVDWPDVTLLLGSNRQQASFSATSGSRVTLAYFNVWGDGLATTTALVDGVGTRLNLAGAGSLNRFGLGNARGKASMVVSGGAVLDGTAQRERCAGFTACQNVIGAAAGGEGHLTVTGAGSEASFLHMLHLGSLNYNGLTGLAGQHARGRLDVLDGALLRAEGVSLGDSFSSANLNGSERGYGTLHASGAGSQILIGPSALQGGATNLFTGQGPQGVGELSVENGAQLVLLASASGQQTAVRLGMGGLSTTRIQGADALMRIEGSGDNGFLHLGEGGRGELLVAQGGRLDARLRFVQVGAVGGEGRFSVTGAGSRAELTTASVGVGGGSQGLLTVSAGGLLQARDLTLGAEPAGQGDAVVEGLGSRLVLSGPDTQRLHLGEWGRSSLIVRDGGVLDASAACTGTWCGSILGHLAGSTALLRVQGAGSQALFEGEVRVGAMQRFDGWGTVDGTTRASVELLDGGQARSATLFLGPWSDGPLNRDERSFADMVIAGSGSQWRVSGDSARGWNAYMLVGTHARGQSSLTVSGGGVARLEAQAGQSAFLAAGHEGTGRIDIRGAGSAAVLSGTGAALQLGQRGGAGRMSLSDGAELRLNGGDWSRIQIGESGDASTGELLIASGATASGAREVWIGNGDGAVGALTVTGTGSRLDTLLSGGNAGQIQVTRGSAQWLAGGGGSAFALQIGQAHPNPVLAEVLLDGGGTQLDLLGKDWHRLGLEGGSLVVQGGAFLNGATDAASCVGKWCGAFLANNAGSFAELTVQGTGSRAAFLSNFIVAGSYATAPPATPYVLGQPGGTSTARIEVLGGGRLDTETVSLGYGPQGGAALGTESARVSVLLDGEGSVWRAASVAAQGGPSSVSFNTGVAGGKNAQVHIVVRNGAQLQLGALGTGSALLQLARDGGTASLDVSGTGSAVRFEGGSFRQFIVANGNGQAHASFADGARLDGVVDLRVGRIGGQGSLLLTGEGTLATMNGVSSSLGVGAGGRGVMSLEGGAALRMDGERSATLSVGTAVFQVVNGATVTRSGDGRLTLSGAGTQMQLASRLWGVPAEAGRTLAVVGMGSQGELRVEGGALLSLQGDNPTQQSLGNFTLLRVGLSTSTGPNQWLPGAGNLLLSGAGSRIELVGAGDARVDIGAFAQGVGQGLVRDGAVLASTYIGVGAFGGQGSLSVQGGLLEQRGQWQSQVLGPRLALGFGAGAQGTLTLGEGARVLLDNGGLGDGAALVLGGVNGTPGGSGALLASGGSRIELVSQPGAAAALIGQSGVGFADFSGASQLHLAGGTLFVAREPGSVGTLLLREGSSVQAQAVRVGLFDAHTPGGTGVLVLNSGGTLNADELRIGAGGVVSGHGGVLNVGQVINGGLFSPGNSPGTLTVNGSFTALAGSRLLLEVQSDGQGGFLTDQLLLNGGAVDLSGLAVEFRFLAGTDPNAFLASGGFDIDQFVRADGAALPDSAFGAVAFSASSSDYTFTRFSYTAGGGAVFEAVPVPEPGTWLMMSLGLAGLLMGRRRVKE